MEQSSSDHHGDYFRTMCMELAEAETEQDVQAILDCHDVFSRPENWRFYGDVDNNEGAIANQQSDAIGALVEKLVNSMDAVLTRACRLSGIDPCGSEAPQSMMEAAEKLLGVPGGDVRRLDAKSRRQLGENVYLVASGGRANPSIAVVDQGEGQRPADFPNTFVALHKGSKRSIPFVQGKYHMGGSGVLSYCGRQGFQLIVSRRQPELTEHPSVWGFTVVRLTATAGRTWSFQYFAPGGRIASFEADSLPLLPGGRKPRAVGLASGTYVKLFEYELSQKSMVQTNLFRTLNLRFFAVPLPIMVFEGRDYQSEAPWAILDGMRARLNGSTAVTDGFPIHWDKVKIAEGNYVKVTAWLLREDVEVSRQEWTRPDSAICLTVNGQTHVRLPKSFFERKSVNKDYLRDYLLVEVDCSDLHPAFHRRIFMPSRDRLRDTTEWTQLEVEIARLLKEDGRLSHENERRRELRMARRLDKSEEYRLMLSRLLDTSPELARMLGGYGLLNNPYKRSQQGSAEPFRGQRFPTYLTLATPRSGILSVPRNSHRRAMFQTDAQNDYLERACDPGILTISHPDWVRGVVLRDGHLTIHVEPPGSVSIGEQVEFEVNMSTPTTPDGLKHILPVSVAPPEPTQAKPSGRRNPTTSQVAMPNINPVYRAEWPDEWSERTVAQIQFNDKVADVHVNMDNVHLVRFLQDRRCRGRETAAKNAFLYGLGLIALAVRTKLRTQDVDIEAVWDAVMDSLAMSWTPLLLHFAPEISVA